MESPESGGKDIRDRVLSVFDSNEPRYEIILRDSVAFYRALEAIRTFLSPIMVKPILFVPHIHGPVVITKESVDTVITTPEAMASGIRATFEDDDIEEAFATLFGFDQGSGAIFTEPPSTHAFSASDYRCVDADYECYRKQYEQAIKGRLGDQETAEVLMYRLFELLHHGLSHGGTVASELIESSEKKILDVIGCVQENALKHQDTQSIGWKKEGVVAIGQGVWHFRRFSNTANTIKRPTNRELSLFRGAPIVADVFIEYLKSGELPEQSIEDLMHTFFNS